MVSAFFEQEKVCPVCEQKFPITRVRSSAAVVVKRESDFYVHYRDINPVHYSILVCPHCQYAALDKKFNEPLSPAAKMRLQKGLALLKKEIPDLSKERNSELAMKATELAIQSAQIMQAGPGLIGSLYLRAAWCARELENWELEKKYIDQARILYKTSFEKEHLRESKMSETRMMYIIGELHRRSGYYQEAVQWFSRVVTHRDIKREPEIERLARDQWEEAKEQYRKQQKESTETKNVSIEENPGTSVAAAEQETASSGPPTPKPAPKNKRSKNKVSVNLYMDQLEWLKELCKKNYAQTKIMVEVESALRAVIDAVKEMAPELAGFNNEDEMKEKIKSTLADISNK